MAYPFAAMPSVQDFITSCTEKYGARLRETEGEVVGPKGPVKFRYLEREVAGQKKRSAPLPDDNAEMFTPPVLRSYCRQLGIPVEDFGLVLG